MCVLPAGSPCTSTGLSPRSWPVEEQHQHKSGAMDKAAAWARAGQGPQHSGCLSLPWQSRHLERIHNRLHPAAIPGRSPCRLQPSPAQPGPRLQLDCSQVRPGHTTLLLTPAVLLHTAQAATAQPTHPLREASSSGEEPPLSQQFSAASLQIYPHFLSSAQGSRNSSEITTTWIKNPKTLIVFEDPQGPSFKPQTLAGTGLTVVSITRPWCPSRLSVPNSLVQAIKGESRVHQENVVKSKEFIVETSQELSLSYAATTPGTQSKLESCL